MDKNLVEIKRFIKDSKNLIRVGTVVIALLFSFSMFIISRSTVSTEVETPELSLGETKKAVFEMYIENEDGTMFTNNNLLNGLFANEDFVETVKSKTSVNLNEVKELFIELGLEEKISPVHAFRNSSNGVITVTVRTGNEVDNLNVASFIFDSMMSGHVNFFNNKILYPFMEPKVIEETEEDNEVLQINESLQSERTLFKQIRNGIIGIMIGFVFSIGIAFLRAIFGKNLNYSFTYHVKENQEFFLSDKDLDNEKHVAKFIGIPYKTKKAILVEIPLSDEDKEIISDDQYLTFENEEGKTALKQTHSLTEFNIKNELSEIILIIKPYQTTRKWYELQKSLIELYEVPVKIVQINE